MIASSSTSKIRLAFGGIGPAPPGREPLQADGEGGDLFGEGGGGGDSGGEKDPMYDQAVAVVLQDRKASISYVQRKLKIGYNRSARLLEDMEKAGLVSALTSSGQRDILVAARGGSDD